MLRLKHAFNLLTSEEVDYARVYVETDNVPAALEFISHAVKPHLKQTKAQAELEQLLAPPSDAVFITHSKQNARQFKRLYPKSRVIMASLPAQEGKLEQFSKNEALVLNEIVGMYKKYAYRFLIFDQASFVSDTQDVHAVTRAYESLLAFYVPPKPITFIVLNQILGPGPEVYVFPGMRHSHRHIQVNLFNGRITLLHLTASDLVGEWNFGGYK